MALSEYMPYGAPELLEGASARLARSMLFAVVAVAILVPGLGALVAHRVTPLTNGPVEIPWAELLPPLTPQRLEPAPPPVNPVRLRVDPFAHPLPLDDRFVPAQDTATPTPPGASLDLSRNSEGGRSGVQGQSGPTTQDPAIGEPVFVDEYPSLVTSVEPRYPDLAREAGVEGVVRVLMLVGLDGRVERAMIAPAGSVPMLDEAALAAARGCVFTPALTNRHAVKVWVSRSYRFRLH